MLYDLSAGSDSLPKMRQSPRNAKTEAEAEQTRQGDQRAINQSDFFRSLASSATRRPVSSKVQHQIFLVGGTGIGQAGGFIYG